MDQNTAITKAATVFTLVTFDCWFLYNKWEAGSISGGGVFWKSDIYTKLENKTLGLPLSPPNLTLGNKNYCSMTGSIINTDIFSSRQCVSSHSELNETL